MLLDGLYFNLGVFFIRGLIELFYNFPPKGFLDLLRGGGGDGENSALSREDESIDS
jgi:hypothetical protein